MSSVRRVGAMPLGPSPAPIRSFGRAHSQVSLTAGPGVSQILAVELCTTGRRPGGTSEAQWPGELTPRAGAVPPALRAPRSVARSADSVSKTAASSSSTPSREGAAAVQLRRAPAALLASRAGARARRWGKTGLVNQIPASEPVYAADRAAWRAWLQAHPRQPGSRLGRVQQGARAQAHRRRSHGSRGPGAGGGRQGERRLAGRRPADVPVNVWRRLAAARDGQFPPSAD